MNLIYPESRFPYLRDGSVQYTLDVPERFLLNFLYTVLDVPGKYDKSCLVPASSAWSIDKPYRVQ